MTNGEKFKSAEERRAAYEDYCVECGKKNMMLMDVFKWLEMEYKDHKEELKSCPFCGSIPVMADNIESMKSLSYYVKCVCGARFASALTESAAAEMWNRRAK